MIRFEGLKIGFTWRHQADFFFGCTFEGKPPRLNHSQFAKRCRSNEGTTLPTPTEEEPNKLLHEMRKRRKCEQQKCISRWSTCLFCVLIASVAPSSWRIEVVLVVAGVI